MVTISGPTRAIPVSLLVFVVGCGAGDLPSAPRRAPRPDVGSVGAAAARVPLIDMGTSTYFGFPGGLYPGGNKNPPVAHVAAGLTRSSRIVLRDAAGNPSASGRYVLLSIGMSSAAQEFCSARGTPPCDPWTFMGRAAADPAVNRGALFIANGAAGGRDITSWDDPADPDYERIRTTWLGLYGLTERQVEVVWLKDADASATASLPDAAADVYALEAALGRTIRALRIRYPNLQLVFISSRIYGGYSSIASAGEPFSYETGFAVKWLIQAQIAQMANGGVVLDPRAGDLNYNTVAPWIAWGPYLWADGVSPRSDGLTWPRIDFEADGVHPSQTGETKVAGFLLTFFKSSQFTGCWFVVGGACGATSPPPPALKVRSDNFNRPNGAIGANWAYQPFIGYPQILGNRLAAFNQGLVITWWARDPFGPDQFSEGVVAAGFDSVVTTGVQVFVRRQATGIPYRYGFFYNAIAREYHLKLDGGEPFVIARVPGTQFKPGDVVRIEVRGSTLSGFVNGVRVIVGADPTLKGGSIGVAIGAGTGSGRYAFDSWQGGEVAPLTLAAAVAAASRIDPEVR